jgi:Outer membrane protein beta-barrel domain
MDGSSGMRRSVLLLLMAAAPSAAAQSPARIRGTHTLELAFGLLTGARASTEVAVGGGQTLRSSASGTLVSLGYGYRVGEDWSLQTSVGVAQADATVSAGGAATSVETAVVIPVLFGVKYQPRALMVGTGFSPYVSAGLGPYVGQTSSVRAGPTTFVGSRLETVPGARVAIGTDVSLGSRFTLGAAAAYRPVADFSAPIGTRTNYSGAEFSLSIGLRLGGGVR